MTRALLFNLIALAIFVIGIGAFFHFSGSPTSADLPANSQLSAVSVSQATSTPTLVATSSLATTSIASSTPSQSPKKSISKAILPVSTTTNTVTSIPDPYSTPPTSFDQINTDARAALVNILCEPQGSSSLNPISGSGVIIDPRGIILTNAHVAQYVLLSESPAIDLNCVIRTGSPAQAQWSAAVLYIPPVWVDAHVSDILESHPAGTGEHDYALLYITGSLNANPLPAQFPYLPVDTRSAVAFPGDQVMIASYPAEFVGGIAAQYNLFADSSVTTIKQLLTFTTDSPDVLSLGGVIEAQGGSSGGAVVNAWDRLVGLIATTSEGTTTADRDLRAEALSYVNADLKTQTGSDLNTILEGNPVTQVQTFNATLAPGLIKLYLPEISAGSSQ